MLTKVFFLIALFGVASSKLPKTRKCDPEEKQVGPTLCSNYKNIEYLDRVKQDLRTGQNKLEQRILAVEKQMSKIDGLQSLVMDLEKSKSETEKEFKVLRKQLAKYQEDIASLNRDVKVLLKHRERTQGNFNEIEERLNTTEKQLREKKAKLENLETETETALNNTQTLLNLYKEELSHLNETAQELEDKVKANLDTTTTDLEAKLKNIQTTSDTFIKKLKEQKTEVDKFKGEAVRRFNNVDEQLKTQNTALDKQRADTDTLKRNTAGIANRLKAAEDKVVALEKYKQQVDRHQAHVNAKVAFSATIINSKGVFTGPKTAHTSNILIFNRVFANVGNAYNHKTGIFTAPLKGVYYFSFMTFGYNSHSSGAILVKNGHYQVSTWEFKGPDISDTTSNAIVLELNAGDCINIILWEGGKIHTGVFSGFLIFPTS